VTQPLWVVLPVAYAVPNVTKEHIPRHEARLSCIVKILNRRFNEKIEPDSATVWEPLYVLNLVATSYCCGLLSEAMGLGIRKNTSEKGRVVVALVGGKGCRRSGSCRTITLSIHTGQTKGRNIAKGARVSEIR